jgi:integrase
MPQRHLTDRFCSGAKPRDGEPQTDYFDIQVSGLALRVSQNGHRSWTLHYTFADKRKRLTFGTYPTLGLAVARTRADEIKADVAAGHQPRSISTDTLQAICDEYTRREGRKLRSASWRNRVLERHVYPTLGARPITEIRRSEIVRLLDGVEEGAGPAMADKTLGIIRKIMNWHATRTDDFRSPIVPGMTRGKANARDRILTDDELRAIWRTDGGMFGRLVRFLLLTAARRSEAAEMTWAEIDGADWTLPAARNKVRVDLVRPLSRAAQSVLPERNGEFVFSANGTMPIRAISIFKRTFDEASGTSGWTLHDCRRTARSLMSRAGVPSDHAERCLGHVIGGVRGVYDRHEYHREKARAFEMLAGEIARVVEGGSAKVVTMKGKR